MNEFENQIFYVDVLSLLGKLFDELIDVVICDFMYGIVKNYEYEWGIDLVNGDLEFYWEYYELIYE